MARDIDSLQLLKQHFAVDSVICTRQVHECRTKNASPFGSVHVSQVSENENGFEAGQVLPEAEHGVRQDGLSGFHELVVHDFAP